MPLSREWHRSCECSGVSTGKAFLQLYERGFFPMGTSDGSVRAYCYDPRGVLPIRDFHVPRRLERWLGRSPYQLTLNQAFQEVIDGCARRPKTWIHPPIRRGFVELHQMGLAHSLEAWLDGQLVGGLYGLALGGTFCGESMFHNAPQASKACLVELVKRLRQSGFDLIDCQEVTPTLAQFGAHYVSFEEYYTQFQRLRGKDCRLSG